MRMVPFRAALAASSLLAFTACDRAPGAGSPDDANGVSPKRSVESALAAKPRPASVRSPDGPRERAVRRRAPKRRARPGASSGTPESLAVLYGGGLVTAAPKVVPILFPGNPLDAQIRQYLTGLQGSAWWHTATAEYGVGAITTLPVYVPTDPPPTLATIDDWIVNLAANPPAGLPAPDDNTIYAIILPPGWQQDTGACITWGGYHEGSFTSSGQVVSHTVNPTCTVPYLGLSGVDAITTSLSHEILESATDAAATGYIGENWKASGWGVAGEAYPSAELADMCEFQPDIYYRDPQSGFLEQRSWSNASSAAGHDPCVPFQPGAGPYFTADAVPPDGTQTDAYAYSIGVSIPPGEERTISVVLRSDGPVGEWQLSAEEQVNPHLAADIYNELSFSWDRASGRAGDTRHLTIKRSPLPTAGRPCSSVSRSTPRSAP